MAVDPTQLAEEQEQRQRIQVAGAPTEFAKGPEAGVQLAGGGTKALLEVLNKLKPSVTPVLPYEADAAIPPGVSPESVVQPSRVPTPQEIGLVPDPGKYSERRTQEILAPEVLSPEGVEEFQRRGFKAQEPVEEQTIQNAAEALDEQAAEAELLVGDVKKQARDALTAETRGFKPETGVADEKLADQMADQLLMRRGQIKTLEDGGDFNFDYMTTTDDVKETITALSEVYRDQTKAVKRGYISNEVTADKAAKIIADEVGLTRTLLKRKIGDGTLSAEMMLASRELLVRSAEKLTGLATKIKEGTATATDRLAFRRQMAIHAGIQLQVKGAQTEAARTLQSFQIKVGGELSAVEQAREAQRLLQETGGADLVDAMADNLLKVQKENGQRGINDFARGGWRAKTRQMLSEAYLSGLLSNPATQMKNVVGTASFMAYQLPAEMIAGMYGSVIRGGRGALKLPISDDQVYVDDAMLRFKGWMDSYKDGLKAASIAWRTEVPAAEASRLDVENYTSIAGESNAWTSKAISEFGKRVRIPFRLLLATDEYFKTISQRGELYVQANKAYKKALRNGKTVQQAQDEAGMILLDPRSVSEELDYKAKLDTLQSDLGQFGKFTGMAQRVDVAGIPVGRMILPFATAPTNSFLRTTEFMGLNPKVYADIVGKNGSRAQQMALGRLSVGGATMAVVADYAIQGSITGGMPSDPKVRDALPPGWQPYSFVFRGEGFPEDMPLYDVYGRPNGPLEYVSYSGYEPVGAVIALTADTVQRMHRTRDPEVRNNLAAAAVGSVIDYYKELPMLQGLSDVAFALEYNDPMRFFRSPAEAATPIGLPNPVSSLQRAGGRMVDPRVMRPRGDIEYYTMADIEAKNEDGTFVFAKPDGTPDYNMVGLPKGDFGSSIISMMSDLSAYQSKDSVFRDEYDRNAPAYDTLGNEIGANDVSLATNPGLAIFNNLSGIRIRQGEEVPDYQAELMRLASMTGGWPLTNPTSMGGVQLAFGAQSDLVNIAKNEIEIRQARIGRVTFKEALEAMTTTVTTPLGRAYDLASDKDRVTMIKALNKQYIDAGFQVLLEMPRYANLAQAYADKQRVKEEQ
jgi:hypothetical protein